MYGMLCGGDNNFLCHGNYCGVGALHMALSNEWVHNWNREPERSRVARG